MARLPITVLALAIVLAVLPHTQAQTGTITFVSDTTWAVSDPSGTVLGFAQNVCLNASAPANCPTGAMLYGFSSGGWTANLSSIPGATWIWAPRITGATSPAFPAEFFFSKTLSLPGSPAAGTLSVAVDDFAEVRVNGMFVGTTGSLTNISLAGAAQSSLATFNILPFLLPGANVITIRAANGPFGCGSGPYSCNPAAVVFGGSLQFRPLEVDIDIKPGSFPNSINLAAQGVVPVAILTTRDFNAATVNVSTVLFAGAAPLRSALEDVDGDGDLDLVLHFDTQALSLTCASAQATLTGRTNAGTSIQGTDSVRIVRDKAGQICP